MIDTLRAAMQGFGGTPLQIAVQGLLPTVELNGVDPFDWSQPRQQPATAHPSMLRTSQQLWLLRMRRPR